MADDQRNELEIWVIDTSSIIQVKHVTPRNSWKSVYTDLASMVAAGQLVYPKQVIPELDSYKTKGFDRPSDWAKKNSTQATRHGDRFKELAQVMNHNIASKVCDPNKAFGPEEADPYVLALALYLKGEGRSVTVVTEESKTTPMKLALNQACGALRIYAVTVELFLLDRSILPKGAPSPSQGPVQPTFARRK